ncbi:bifunctional hydroxymethylpyrimidine kinase/phosphomethylpyrimidine kinase [Leucobacter aridicollis]|uniref:bifunctional hydroxymethylpyrimidine kinase/phosphomethylpyrimidine kinase n=1 Tax=Leucobacter aridicollis TaxID=283878 RepID=UPI0021055775|nr:bifunctional hydroxymethylpyrimidine kinase/phosphomethylpyrimidine kinase [Leucobacter aridicollis]UTX54023.1 bifunctional hydroxymethylpyrimidine kinase/phosphomethylpyrimidine kinase [Leucobacter aridicollis]
MTNVVSVKNRRSPREFERIGERRRAVQLADARQLELTRRPAHILAIGSQLAHGSVGLNAAARVFGSRGAHAITLPTILLSVMPHYAAVHDVQVPAAWLADTLRDLAAADALTDLQWLSTGYFATLGQPTAVADWFASQAESTRPALLVDPTLGDAELGFYTDPGLVDEIRSELLPLATGIVPNRFELAHLSASPLAELSSRGAVEEAARSIMGPQTEWVVVTGVRLPSRQPRIGGPADICDVLVTPTWSSVHRQEEREVTAKGLGDTFAAALTTALLERYDIDEAVEFASGEVRRALAQDTRASRD